MNSTSDEEMTLPCESNLAAEIGDSAALIGDLRECMHRLDQIGANLAAVHVDAAIHSLLSSLASGNSSKTD